jgi:regulator of replication initiation timing
LADEKNANSPVPGTSNDPNKEIVEETQRLWDLYKRKRDHWEFQAREDQEYRLGRQWTKEQETTLKARGQAPIVVNRVHPAVETAKALLTANRPSFKVSPREDSDVKVANVLNQLLSYMYDISDGRAVVRQAVDDYYVTGMGYVLVYQNPQADDGKGEVMIKDIDPLDVYVDPNSRDPFFDDAASIIISRNFTKEQAKALYPQYKQAIDAATGSYESDQIITGNTDDTGITFPGEIDTLEDNDYVRGYERYYKVNENAYRVHEKYTGKEYRFNEEEFQQYVSTEVGLLNGQILEGPNNINNAQAQQSAMRDQILEKNQKLLEEDIHKLREELEVQYMEKEKQLAEQVQLGNILQDRAVLELTNTREAIDKQIDDTRTQAMTEAGQVPNIPNVEMKTKAHLISEGMIEAVPISVKKVKQCIVIGDTYLYSRILPTSNYPLVPVINLHTRTPYPMSDIRMVKGLQDYINKTRSLIIAHATTATNMKVLVPAGSVDMQEFEQKWAQPGVGIEVDFDMGQPVVASPAPLPNELYNNEQTAKNDIDHQLGLYEMMMGNSQAAPQTYKATISLDEFGQRKIKSKLADIEGALQRVAKIAIVLMQELYQEEKIFQVVNPNNTLSEFAINKKLYDDKSDAIAVANDITVGKYDVVYVSGSTLPSNRYAELEFYMDAYSKGLIDRQEVLKKTEVFDMEGVLERTDTIGQLEQQVQSLSEQLKKLGGDMQTMERENVHLKQKVEVEKFKTELDQTSNKAKMASSLFEKRLDDNLSMVSKEIQDAVKEKTDSTPSASKGQSKKRKK